MGRSVLSYQRNVVTRLHTSELVPRGTQSAEDAVNCSRKASRREKCDLLFVSQDEGEPENDRINLEYRK